MSHNLSRGTGFGQTSASRTLLTRTRLHVIIHR
jgi:hypothetical protein